MHRKQRNYALFWEYRTKLDEADSPNLLFQHEILSGRSQVDVGIHHIISTNLRQANLYHARCPIPAGHPRVRRMYDTMWLLYYWPGMIDDVYVYVEQCPNCWTNRQYSSLEILLQLFHFGGTLKFVVMNILDPRTITKSNNRCVVVVANWYSKPTRSIPAKHTTAAYVVEVSLDVMMIIYVIPERSPPDRRPRLTKQFFNAVCFVLGTQLQTKTAYHPRMNG